MPLASGRLERLTYLACPITSPLAALCVATRDEEQAVSTVMAGPRNPKVNASRPEATDNATPGQRAHTPLQR